MELLLQNLTFAKLEKSDIKRIKDKNIIKLLKLGQLTTEYLLYTHVSCGSMMTIRNMQKDIAKAMKENIRHITMPQLSLKSKSKKTR
jgi:hypothetical protein